jgi:hypothetical protein
VASSAWTARNLRPFAGAEHKGAVSASFRRPTKVFEDGVQKSNNKYLLNVDGIIASRGGIPLIDDAKSAARARPGRRTRRLHGRRSDDQQVKT